MDEKLYRELGQLTKDKSIWKQNIPYVASLLKNQSPKITAKAMWLLGEMGLIYPQEVAPYTKEIASFIVSENDLLRERTANALGRAICAARRPLVRLPAATRRSPTATFIKVFR